ncbi:MAG: rhodanese-like domain-containing protein [Succinatimonas sp.]|nr:rhodanese-like domain-containing protein [Succinatimonas sp.]MDY5722725.1 rhodanese-like domain-containing protein [Succinivibrio sp.]
MGELFSSDNVDQYIRFASNHQIMVMIFVVLFVALIYFQVRIMLANVKKISANNATAMVNHEDGVFVDVRANKLFTSGHIAGSINITLAEIKEGKLNRIDSYKDKPVILVGRDKMDADCFNSAVSLKKQGYTKVFSLDGGIAQWTMDNLPTSVKD